jgi:RNA polymerase sigma factor (TIGR02999 family)
MQQSGEDAVELFVRSIYPSLREIAGRLLRNERPNHTLRKTALVHEALVRLLQSKGLLNRKPEHVLAIAARQMRRVLIDYGRKRGTQKRFGGLTRVPIPHERVPWRDETERLALSQALERLGQYDARALRVVELKWIAGCTNSETAAILGVSDTTIENIWLHARLWLCRELAGADLAEVVDKHDVRITGIDLSEEQSPLVRR